MPCRSLSINRTNPPGLQISNITRKGLARAVPQRMPKSEQRRTQKFSGETSVRDFLLTPPWTVVPVPLESLWSAGHQRATGWGETSATHQQSDSPEDTTTRGKSLLAGKSACYFPVKNFLFKKYTKKCLLQPSLIMRKILDKLQ